MAIIRFRDPGIRRRGIGAFPARNEFNLLKNEVNQLFDEFFGNRSAPSAAGVFPPVNLYQDSENIYLMAELPGLEARDIELKVEPESILLKGSRKSDPEAQGTYYHRRERESGSFSRKITFPTRIATDRVSAKIINGILTISMPLAEDTRPKRIDVEVV